MRRAFALTALTFALAFPAAAELPPGKAIPHVGESARQAFDTEYRAAPAHKAFVIGPGGSWAWVKGAASAEDAEADALERCARLNSHCLPFAVDDKAVFDPVSWAGVLAPYPKAADAAAAPVGAEKGQRFFDLGFRTRAGAKTSVAALKGKIAVIQFWGAWCPPCRVEMPAFQKLHATFADRPDVAFVLLNYREDAQTSYRWVERNGYKMPFADSGSRGREDDNLYLADGTAIPYGKVVPLAQVPTTFFLDRNGLVLFRKSGATDSWPEMAEQIRHALEHSAR